MLKNSSKKSYKRLYIVHEAFHLPQFILSKSRTTSFLTSRSSSRSLCSRRLFLSSISHPQQDSLGKSFYSSLFIFIFRKKKTNTFFSLISFFISPCIKCCSVSQRRGATGRWGKKEKKSLTTRWCEWRRWPRVHAATAVSFIHMKCWRL